MLLDRQVFLEFVIEKELKHCGPTEQVWALLQLQVAFDWVLSVPQHCTKAGRQNK